MTARIVALVSLLILTSCGLPANIVVLIPDEDGNFGKIAVHEGTSTIELAEHDVMPQCRNDCPQ